MTVAELIEFLKTKPQDIQVGQSMYSEYCLTDPEDIHIVKCCLPRNDDWIHGARPDKPSQDYLMFPGN